MTSNHLFNFSTDVSEFINADQLNNPFGSTNPEIAKIAAREFQDYIASESEKWNYDFLQNKGKMFGVLVVKTLNGDYGYLGTNSGKLPNNAICDKFIPSVLDESIDDYFMNRGMTELSEIGAEIKTSSLPAEVLELKELRRKKSILLQQRLFENYHFTNRSGTTSNLLNIFANSSHDHPPSGAGECAAPKLLQYAFHHDLNPVALAEFWWGGAIKTEERKHKEFYPACKNKCRPILEYMLEDTDLYRNR